MLDNFSPEDIKQAVEIKPEWMNYEVSGGISFDNLEDYLIRGIDNIGRAELAREVEFILLDIDRDDLIGPCKCRTLHTIQANAAATDHHDLRARWHFRCIDYSQSLPDPCGHPCAHG